MWTERWAYMPWGPDATNIDAARSSRDPPNERHRDRVAPGQDFVPASGEVGVQLAKVISGRNTGSLQVQRHSAVEPCYTEKEMSPSRWPWSCTTE